MAQYLLSTYAVEGEVPGAPTTPDVKGEFDRIQGLGATVKQEPYQPGGGAEELWLATFEDPDGNYFQLASPMPTQ